MRLPRRPRSAALSKVGEVERSPPTDTEKIAAGNAESYQDSPSAKLHDESDLYELTGDLGTAVWETVQPEHVLLWLRLALQPNQLRAAERTR